MLSLQDKHSLISAITVPEIKSCIAQTVDGLSGEEGQANRLTLVALVSFYRKNLNNALSVETDNNRLKSRLMQTGVLYFGSMFRGEVSVPRAKRLNQLAEAGFSTNHLAFLNSTQVELFYTYVCETGLVVRNG